MIKTTFEKQLKTLRSYSLTQAEIALLNMGANGHVYIEDDAYINDTFCHLRAMIDDITLDYTVTQLDGTVLTYSDVVLTPTDPGIYGLKISNVNVTNAGTGGQLLAYYSLKF